MLSTESLVKIGKWSEGDQWKVDRDGAREVSDDVITRSTIWFLSWVDKEETISIKTRLKSWFGTFYFVCFPTSWGDNLYQDQAEGVGLALFICVLSLWLIVEHTKEQYSIPYWSYTSLARYNPCVLKVSLNQPTKLCCLVDSWSSSRLPWQQCRGDTGSNSPEAIGNAVKLLKKKDMSAASAI